MNLDAPSLPETKRTNASHMAAANDALNLDVNPVPELKVINASCMVVAHVVLNQDARRLPKVQLIIVKIMVVAIDVQTASLGQIHDVVQLHMMDIVQPVSNKYFPTMNEAKTFTHTRRKSGFAMQSMMCLKDLYMTNHCTQDSVIAPIGVALIIGN
jgi:hypothetical protein